MAMTLDMLINRHSTTGIDVCGNINKINKEMMQVEEAISAIDDSSNTGSMILKYELYKLKFELTNISKVRYIKISDLLSILEKHDVELNKPR